MPMEAEMPNAGSRPLLLLVPSPLSALPRLTCQPSGENSSADACPQKPMRAWSASENLHRFSLAGSERMPVLVFAVLVAQSCPTLLQPHGLQPTWLLCPRDFPGKDNWSALPFPPPGDLSDPEIKPESPVWKADSLPLSHLGSLKECLVFPQIDAPGGYYPQQWHIWRMFSNSLQVGRASALGRVSIFPGIGFHLSLFRF